MKKSKFSESQILSILKQHEAGVVVSELAREHGADLTLACQIQWLGCTTDEISQNTQR